MGLLFFGSYEHQLDDKNRLRVPAKFKEQLGKEYYFARSPEDCVYVFPADVLSEMVNKLSEETLGGSSKASLVFLSSIFQAEEDPQGRVVLPSRLKEAAGIQKDIITVGRGKRLEIWAAEKFNEMCEAPRYKKEFKSLGI